MKTLTRLFTLLALAAASLGMILKHIDELGLRENTIVAFSTDQGADMGKVALGGLRSNQMGCNGPVRGGKHTHWEGGVRVPWIVRWPGHIPAGRTDEQSVLSGADWLPTLTATPDNTPPAQQKPLIDSVIATPDELAAHIREALDWTKANCDLNPSNAVIIYGWNENDDGGWLLPTLGTDGKPDEARINALGNAQPAPWATVRQAPTMLSWTQFTPLQPPSPPPLSPRC